MKDFTVDNLSQSIAASLSASINLNGYASFVVCGGSSPLSLYDNLSNKDLDWSKVSIFLGVIELFLRIIQIQIII